MMITLKGAVWDFYNLLTGRQWPGRNRAQIACNTSSAYHVQDPVPRATKGQLSFIHITAKHPHMQGRPAKVTMAPGAGIMKADDRPVTTVFTVQPSFHHRHSSIIERFHRRRRTRWGVTARSPTMVTLHDTHKAELNCFIFSHMFQLIRMNFDMVLK